MKQANRVRGRDCAYSSVQLAAVVFHDPGIESVVDTTARPGANGLTLRCMPDKLASIQEFLVGQVNTGCEFDVGFIVGQRLSVLVLYGMVYRV